MSQVYEEEGKLQGVYKEGTMKALGVFLIVIPFVILMITMPRDKWWEPFVLFGSAVLLAISIICGIELLTK